MLEKVDGTEYFRGTNKRCIAICPICKKKYDVAVVNVARVNQCKDCYHKSLSGKNNPNYRHGGACGDTRLYMVWGDIINRTKNKNHPSYDRYGGRGINVCNEWKDFKLFQKWSMNNGYKPGMTIDRINNDKGYSAKNCRWVTNQINCQNSSQAKIDLKTASKIKKLLLDKTIVEVSKETGLSECIIADIKSGRTWRNAK